MRKRGRVLMAMVVAGCVGVWAGCPGGDANGGDGLEGSWRAQQSETDPETGATFTDGDVLALSGDGRVVFVEFMEWSGSGWSGELRHWIKGAYTLSGGIITLDFTGASCEDMAAKLVTSGEVPAQYEEMLNLLFEVSIPALSTYTEEPMAAPYAVEGDTLWWTEELEGQIEYGRFTDSYNYGNPDVTGCDE